MLVSPNQCGRRGLDCWSSFVSRYTGSHLQQQIEWSASMSQVVRLSVGQSSSSLPPQWLELGEISRGVCCWDTDYRHERSTISPMLGLGNGPPGKIRFDINVDVECTNIRLATFIGQLSIVDLRYDVDSWPAVRTGIVVTGSSSEPWVGSARWTVSHDLTWRARHLNLRKTSRLGTSLGSLACT